MSRPSKGVPPPSHREMPAFTPHQSIPDQTGTILLANTHVYVGNARYRLVSNVRVVRDELPESPRGGWMP